MNYRRLRGTDIEVSELGVGCARLGGVFYRSSEAETISLLHSAFDAGITFYDTADMYAQGESERVLGKAFAASRGKVIIASKVGYKLPAQRRMADKLKPIARPIVRLLGLRGRLSPTMIRGNLSQDFSPDWIQSSLEGSLARLGTDYLDVYLLHGVPGHGLEGALESLRAAKAKGMVRSFGVSCDTVAEASECLDYLDGAVVQVGASMLHQEIVPFLNDERVQNTGVVARQCYASGLLAKPASETNFAGLPPERKPAVQALEALASEMGRELPELALKFVNSLRGVDITLVGIRTEQHLRDALKFHAAAPLSESELAAVMARG